MDIFESERFYRPNALPSSHRTKLSKVCKLLITLTAKASFNWSSAKKTGGVGTSGLLSQGGHPSRCPPDSTWLKFVDWDQRRITTATKPRETLMRFRIRNNKNITIAVRWSKDAMIKKKGSKASSKIAWVKFYWIETSKTSHEFLKYFACGASSRKKPICVKKHNHITGFTKIPVDLQRRIGMEQ